ncbi:MAG: DUF2490 domain-containing protein [Bacteroidota bacterium]
MTVHFMQNVNAQNSTYINAPQLWSEADFSGKFTQKLFYQFDLQYARQGSSTEINLFKYNSQLTIRPWLHYFIKPTLRLSGFAGLWYNYGILDVGQREYPEWRTAQQVTFYSPKNKFTLSNRLRIEERFIKDRTGNFESVLRFRYQIKCVAPIAKHTPEIKGASYLVGFDEFFINGGSTVTGHSLFDQNRIFIGYGYYLTDNLILETGYFNQFQLESNDRFFDVNHVWQITFYINNAFNKKIKNTTPDSSD